MTAKKKLLFSIPTILALVLITVTLRPAWREKIQAYLTPTGHQVLATAEGDLLNDGTTVKVVKYRSGEGIYVRVLSMDETGATTIIDRVALPDKHDGLFNYQGHVTRLAIADIDGDGRLELLAPSFDHQLVPHLNVYRFNPTTRRFDPYRPEK